MSRFSGRQVGGLIVALIGLQVIASGFLINPWLGALWKGDEVGDSIDVLTSYFLWSIILGFLLVGLGIAIPKLASKRFEGAVILLLMLCLLILVDRALLVRFGLPMWEYDPDVHFRHRPNATRTLASFGRPDALVRFNRYGHHDSDFERAKPTDQFRGLLLGDSVTMAYGLTYDETYCKRTEELLEDRDTKYRSYNVINTAVHGYSVFQEAHVLRESLIFDPDFVAVGFVMNDVTEPFVSGEMGPAGLDYHEVTPAGNSFLGYLYNDTGLGRLMQKLSLRSKTLDHEMRAHTDDISEMAANSETSPKHREGWRLVLSGLKEIYSIAEENDLPVVLMIFPFLPQLLDENLRAPQRILKEHAAKCGVDVIDFTDVLRDEIYDRPLLAFLRDKGHPEEDVGLYFQGRVDQYFFDALHMTERAHRIIGDRLFDWLVARDLVTVR